MLQFSNEVLAASTAPATSSVCAWRQLAKFSPGEMNGGNPVGRWGEPVSELEGADISGAQKHPKAVKLVPLPHTGSQFYHLTNGDKSI